MKNVHGTGNQGIAICSLVSLGNWFFLMIYFSTLKYFIHSSHISFMAFHQHATMKNWANLIFFPLVLKKCFLIQSYQVLFPSKKWFLIYFKNNKQEDTGEIKLYNDLSVTYLVSSINDIKIKWLIIPTAPLRTLNEIMCIVTLTSIQCSERGFGGAK